MRSNVADDPILVLSERIRQLEAKLERFITRTGTSAAEDFLDLTDTPATYTGQAGKFVQVNAGETAVEFDPVTWTDVQSKPTTFAPSSHASSHQHGGGDEVGTATPGANAIVKADSDGKINAGWIDDADIDHGSIGGLADDDHTQYHNDTRGDARYYQKTEFLATSAGAGDAGKPVKLDAAGHIDATMVNDGDVDHGSVGGLADDDHTQYHNDTRGDARYYQKTEHKSTSAGAGDAGKPIVLDAAGHVDATMINDGDIDHGSIGGLADDDHTQYHNDTRGDARYYTKSQLNTSGGGGAVHWDNITAPAAVEILGTPTADDVMVYAGSNVIESAGFASADVARLSIAQTFASLATFSSGIKFAHETLNYYDEGTWTPSDASGAGLSFTSPTGRYTRIGRMVFAEFSLTFPTTADTANATIGSLPFTPAAFDGTSRGGGFLMNVNLGEMVIVRVTSGGILFLDTLTNPFTNADMSGKLLRGTVIYTV